MSLNVIARPLIYPVDLIPPPPDTDSFIAACAQYTLYYLPALYEFGIIQNNYPGSSNRNKVWFWLDGNGAPVGTYVIFNGQWRLVYSGLPFEIRYFYNTPAGYFDSTGLGFIGGPWDGWALCNGNNGTQDLRDQFLLSGNYAVSAFGWYTILVNPVTPSPSTAGGTDAASSASTQALGALTGGSATITLQVYNLPALNCSIPLTSETLGGSQFYALSVTTGGSPSGGGPVGETFVNGINTGSAPNIDIVPPYIAVAAATFIGYQD